MITIQMKFDEKLGDYTMYIKDESNLSEINISNTSFSCRSGFN